MKKTRLDDINNRYSLAAAERMIYNISDKQYKQLSEIMRVIRSEYKTQNAKSNRNRYGFRLRGENYELVVLDDSQII